MAEEQASHDPDLEERFFDVFKTAGLEESEIFTRDVAEDEPEILGAQDLAEIALRPEKLILPAEYEVYVTSYAGYLRRQANLPDDETALALAKRNIRNSMVSGRSALLEGHPEVGTDRLIDKPPAATDPTAQVKDIIEERIKFYGLEPLEYVPKTQVFALAELMCSPHGLSREVFDRMLGDAVDEHQANSGPGLNRDSAIRMCVARLRYLITMLNPERHTQILEYYLDETGEVNS